MSRGLDRLEPVPAGAGPPGAPTGGPGLVERRAAFARLGRGLARIRRWNGASGVTVAQHLAQACDAAAAEVKPYALLHDCEEWELGDLLTPVKARMAALGLWRRFEAAAVLPVRRRYSLLAGIGWPWPDRAVAAVDAIDRRLAATEWRDAVDARALAVSVQALPAPYEWRMAVWSSETAAAAFLTRAETALPGLRAAGTAGAER